MTSTLSLTEQIEAAFPTLSPQLRRAARYVLDAPDDVALSSMRTVASNAGVHPSSLVRLAKELAFNGYAEFREPFRQRLRTHADRYADRARLLQARGVERNGHQSDDLLQEILQMGKANLERTFTATSATELTDLANMLGNARRIYVVGMRKCYPVANYLQYACRMFYDNVVLASGVAATVADDLRDVQSDDVLIAIGFEAYSRGTVRAAQHAVATGAKLVAITDHSLSPLSRGAALSFIIANDSPSFFSSISAAMALAETIVAFLVAHGGEEAVECLRRTERHLESFGIYCNEDEWVTRRRTCSDG